MKNRILCLLALLLSAITCAGDIFAATPVEIQKMPSFKNLPPPNDTKAIPLERYSALIRRLNKLHRKIKVGNRILIDETGESEMEDFTQRGKILAYAGLYECAKFLGVKRYPSSSKGNVFSLDYSWPNICRISKDLVARDAKDILNETFYRLKCAVKYKNDEENKKYQEVAFEKIKKNQEALKDLLEKIEEVEVEIKPEKRNRVTFTQSQTNMFIDLCMGKDAVFDITPLDAENQKLFRTRIEEMLQNYSGFQRICSILAMKLINTIMSRGATGASINIETINKYDSKENKILLTSDTLSGKYIRNYYEPNSKGENFATIYHEITHFFHYMVSNNLMSTQIIENKNKLLPMVIYNICNSKSSLQDLFFPTLSGDKMKNIVEKIKKNLEVSKEFVNFEEEIYYIYKRAVDAGFGNLLFEDSEIDTLTLEKLCDTERLAKAIFIISTCIVELENDSYNFYKKWDSCGQTVWSKPEEIFTIIGIVPLFVNGNETYILEDRQNEEVYAIREEEGKFQSNEEIRKFRYHAAFAYKEVSKRINKHLKELCAPKLKLDEVPGIDEMQFPEHLAFSSTWAPKERASTKVDDYILKQYEDSLSDLIESLDREEQKDLIDYFITAGSTKVMELFIKKVHKNFDWEKIDLSFPLRTGNLVMSYLLLSERGSDCNLKEIEKILRNGTIDAIKEIIADVDPGMDISPNSRPLNCLLRRGFADMAKVLLDKIDKNEAELNFADSYQFNDTPLHYAAEKGYADIVKTLLAKGAKGEANILALIPLYYAASSGHAEIVETLLAKETNVDRMTEPLWVAAMHGYVAVVNLLLNKGANANAVAKVRNTPLHEAAKNCHVEVVNLLLAREANVNIVDNKGRTPLHDAASRGHVEVVNLLLAREANVNIVDDEGHTPLHEAAERDYTNGGYVAIAEALLKAGADASIKTKREQFTPLDIGARAFLDWIGYSSTENAKKAKEFLAIYETIMKFSNKSEKELINHSDKVTEAVSKAKELQEGVD
ncbi:MAG: ankyrin repeat domain-containing protein [Holosporaceae bacterium]|jgi:hypothetical protein|nr:ankyrin repeat domain-containing protein [Holosporaceae bacterium]